MKIVIFGAGSIGCYVGGKLLAAGQDVVLYGRERLQKSINEHGLKITSYAGDKINLSSDRVNYSTSLDSLNDADLVLLTVKSQATKSALAEIKSHTSPSACIVSLQNGVSNERVLKEFLPEYKTAGGMVPYNVVSLGDGHFHRGTEGSLVFEKNYHTGILAEHCKQAGLEVALTEDIVSVLWGKLLMNLNNAINVLSDQPLKFQLEQRAYRTALAACIDEALSVLTAANIKPAQVGSTLFDVGRY